jgi:hypothetical protein
MLNREKLIKNYEYVKNVLSEYELGYDIDYGLLEESLMHVKDPKIFKLYVKSGIDIPDPQFGYPDNILEMLILNDLIPSRDINDLPLGSFSKSLTLGIYKLAELKGWKLDISGIYRSSALIKYLIDKGLITEFKMVSFDGSTYLARNIHKDHVSREINFVFGNKNSLYSHMDILLIKILLERKVVEAKELTYILLNYSDYPELIKLALQNGAKSDQVSPYIGISNIESAKLFLDAKFDVNPEGINLVQTVTPRVQNFLIRNGAPFEFNKLNPDIRGGKNTAYMNILERKQIDDILVSNVKGLYTVLARTITDFLF